MITDTPPPPTDTPPTDRKRAGEDPPGTAPPPKREKLDPSLIFQGEAEAEVQEEAVDFAMALLQREHERRDPREPSLEFSVAPHRGSIGMRASEFVSQICATVKACELPAGDAFARAPVDIVVGLDVSGSMVSAHGLPFANCMPKHLTLRIPSCQRVEKLDLCKKTLNLLLRELHHDDRFCLISFSDEAKVEVPMLKVCDDQKQRAMHTIEHMHVRGRTNIASALSLAAQVANGVKVSSVLRMLMLRAQVTEFSWPSLEGSEQGQICLPTD